MKFIGIPKTVSRRSEKIRAFVGGVLLITVVSLFIFVAKSFFFAPSTISAPTESSSQEPSLSASSANTLPAVDDSLTSLKSRSDDDLLGTTVPTLSEESASAQADVTNPPVATAPAVSETALASSYYVTSDLFIRKGPGTTYEKVGEYGYGDYIDVVAKTDNGWYKLGNGNYVFAEFLSSAPPETETSGTLYATGAVNVRSGPGTDFEVTRKLEVGEPITVVSKTSNGWYKTVKGTYVKKEFFSFDPPSTPTPIPTPQPTAKPDNKPKPTEKPKPTPPPAPGPGEMKYLGSFKVTYYGPQNGNVVTASGAICEHGVTLAVDPSIISLGTSVYVSLNGQPFSINSNGGHFRAQDTGGAIKGNIIDIFVPSEEIANQMNNGIYVDVYIES